MKRTFEEVNQKIKAGTAVVLSAEEAIECANEMGVREAARKVDVVTTGTFGPMCSSGAVLNFGHTDPPIRMGQIWLNDVQCYGGLAAVDTYVGATQPSDSLGMQYGGAHVIEDLLNGKALILKALSYGTDCYPRKELQTEVTLNDINQAILFNPRNAYQNYAAAINTSDATLHTYMGTLLPNMGNITYSTSGALSPLLKDPELRTIGIGTRIFLGGAQGYIAFEGTQAVFNHQTLDNGGDWYAGVTLSVIGDLKKMDSRFIRAAVYDGYGVSMFVGIGIPIPVLDEDLFAQLTTPNDKLYTRVFDYSVPSRSRPALKLLSYEELRSGSVEIDGKPIKTAPLSSYSVAREIAGLLKRQVESGEFLLVEPSEYFEKGKPFKPLNITPKGSENA